MANDSYGTFFSETKIPYDPLWEGPFKKRRHCTNRIWLAILLAFLTLWVIVAIHAFREGDIRKLIVPTDSDGRKCGIDLDVQDKPYLVFFDLTKCTDGVCNTAQVCQANCPTENFLYQSSVGTLDEAKKKIICQIGINKDLIVDWVQLDYYIAKGKCTKWYLKSEPLINRCIPNTPVPAEFKTIISDEQLKNATQVIRQITEVEKTLENIYNDVVNTGYPVLGFIALSALATFLYIILLRWLAKPFVYATIIILCAALAYVTYYSYIQYTMTTSPQWFYFTAACVILLLLIMLSTVSFHRQIHLACQIVKEASKALGSTWSTLFFPVFPWILHILLTLVAAVILFNLKTITVPTYQVQIQELIPNSCVCPPQVNFVKNATCDPDAFASECQDRSGGPCVTAGCYLTETTTPDRVYAYHLINILAFLWLFFFISAFGEMVLAATFATWYWTFDKNNLPNFTLVRSLWITFRYHLGTLAFGSLITWLCDIVRIMVKPFTGSGTNSPISVQPANWLRSLVDMLMSFLQYVNRNAYIMCAIHGKGFCYSAKSAFNLIMRNVLRVFVITNITDWLLGIAKTFIIILTVVYTAAYYTDNQTVNDLHVPAAMALIGSYLITTAGFMVLKSAIDTIFLCFLEDSERNDGSQERPYYMSMRLKQLLQRQS